MRTVGKFMCVASVLAVLMAGSPAFSASSDPITITNFSTSSGITTTETEVQQTWAALQAAGTTSYLGGMIGNFKLDESSMIAGALAVGVTEFDNFLRTGSLSVSASGLGSLLTTAMTGAAGINLSYLTGSFTLGGGSIAGLPFSTATALSSTTGAASTAGQCDSAVAAKQVAVGIQGVSNVVNAATSSQYGFSKNSDAQDSTLSTGFAARDCLDKLFQNAGSDILFKPPSLSNLTQMLQSWTCNAAKSVIDQVTGGFGDMSNLNTASMGGFFPSGVFGEANDGTTPVRPGIGGLLSETFGSTFSEKSGSTDSSLSSLSSVLK